MPLRKDSMVTPLNENFAQAYTKEESTAGVAASDQASGRQWQAGDCAPIVGITFAEPASEKSNSNAYYCEERRTSVQHFLEAASVIIGKRRHRL